MELKHFNVYFFLFFLIGISLVAFLIFQPFMMPILLAAVLAVIFQRPYNFFLHVTNNSKKISAFIVSFLAIIVFAAFFMLVLGLIINQAANLYGSIGNGQSFQKYVNDVNQSINNSALLRPLALDKFINAETLRSSFAQFGQNTFSILQKTYQGIANFLFMTVVMFFTLYYFLIGGKDLVKYIMYLSPLRNAHEKLLIEKFISMSRATIKGNLIIGLLQGTIGAVLFSLVGIKTAIILGVIMMFFSFLPMFGTAFVWLPTGIIMLMLGNVWQGIVILAVGSSIISLIDNFLSPKLIGKDTQMHPLLIFFATLGGIGLWGFLGIVIGPIVLALFLTLWEIYGVEFKSQLRKYNS